MPNGKQDHSHHRARRAMERIEEQLHQAEGMLREEAEHVGQRLREGGEAVREAFSTGMNRAQDVVTEHPVPSVLIGLGLGFGLGMLLTVAVMEQGGWRSRESTLSSALRHLQDRLGRLQEQLAERV
jgi:ElaB/YqjD/DUF883 family membrane-anchored ribosome-binding protein